MKETILITGASGGIGEVFARQYAKLGQDLVLVARSEIRLNHIASELTEKFGIHVKVIPLDLSELNSAERLFQECTDAGIQVNVLINNAGFGLFGKFVELDPKRLEEMMLLNMVSLSKLCRLFLPSMVEKQSGGVINVASTAAFQGIPFFATYAATKAYVLHLTEALHVELKGTPVEVMALCPGPTQTDFFKSAGRGSFGYLQTPEAVVEAALKGFRLGKANVVSGMTNKVTSTLVRFAPRAWVTGAAAKLLERGSK
jgi:hypothetical protein